MMESFVIKIVWMSIASSIVGLMILGIRKFSKKIPIGLTSSFWLIFLAFLVVPFQFENTNHMQIAQSIGEIRENVLAMVEVSNPKAQSISFWNIMFFVHLTVFIALCLKDIFAYIVLKYRIKNEKIELSPKTLKLFDAVKQKLGLKRKIDLVFQGKILTPATVGIFRPMILISKRFSELSEKEQECVFFHELMHIKKIDNIKYFLINMLKNFYWFNPLINFLTRGLKEDIEILTDKLVVKHVEIKKYLVLILKISQFEAPNGGLFPAFAADKKILERRIKIMKRERKLNLAVISLFTVLVGVIGVTGLVFATPPKTTEAHQTSSKASQTEPSSSNSKNNSSSSASDNKVDNSSEKKKYMVKDFQTGKVLTLSQEEYEEYMKKFSDKGYVELKVEDPQVASSIEKDLFKDSAPTTGGEGCYAKASQ